MKNFSMTLLIIGALNWGLIGVTSFWNRFDLIEWITNDLLNLPIIGYIVYIIIGLAAFFAITQMMKVK